MSGTAGNGIGYGKPYTYVFTATAGQVRFAGADDNGVTLTYDLRGLSAFANGVKLSAADFAAPDGSVVTLVDPRDAGDTIEFVVLTMVTGQNYAVAPRNRIINGCMMVSQENGTSGGTSDVYYPVDQFNYQRSHDGTITVAQVASVTPGGSPNRLRATVSGTDTSIAAGQYALIFHNIEGLRVADLQYGTAAAKTCVLRFGVKAPAGTYCVSVRNSALDRSYVREFTITAAQANTDTVQTLTFPGDITGTWLKDTGIGLRIVWALAAGSTYQGSANAWSGSNLYATSNQFNLLGVNSQVFELFDVGFYVDVIGSGVAPTFECENYADARIECQRYWESDNFYIASALSGGGVRATRIPFSVEKRVAPTLSATGTANSPVLDAATTLSLRVYNTTGDLAAGTYIANARL